MRRINFLLLIIFFIFIFGISKIIFKKSESIIVPALTISDGDRVRGLNEAKIVIIEYSDFQCPACAFYSQILKQLSDEFGERIAIVYRHFPLPYHQNAIPAAFAVEAAAHQGKFWEMHDLLFKNQDDWASKSNATEIFIQYANILKLNLEQFKNDLDSEVIAQKIKNDYNGGLKLGVNSTPTFFINGKKINNPRNYEEFRSIIMRLINE